MKKITFHKDTQLTISADQLKVGDKAPNFSLHDSSLTKRTLDDFGGVRVINVFPSIDTRVCDAQTNRFLKELAYLDVVLLNVSVDLPFALDRWCNSAGYPNAIILSDYYDHNFGKSYGVLIDELRLLARSIFVLDSSGTIVYTQITDELSSPLDFDSAFEAIKSAT